MSHLFYRDRDSDSDRPVVGVGASVCILPSGTLPYTLPKVK